MDYDDILTIGEAARLLKLKPDTVRKRLRAGTLPGKRLKETGPWRLSRAQLMALLPHPEAEHLQEVKS